jgi:type IV pilus assembly protein PilV
MSIGKKKQTYGFSLFEVLVALVILAIGMLGIARMLMIAHKSNSSSYVKQQSIQSAYDIVDRVRANRQAAIDGNYAVNNLVASGAPTLPSSPSTNCDSSSCSASQLASYDTWHWLSTSVSQLPNGCGSITTAASGINTLVTVTIQWDDSPNQATIGESSSSPTQLIIQSEL